MKTIRIRAKILVALGAASLALGAAGPASAQPTQPVNKDGKKSCSIDSPSGEKDPKTGETKKWWFDHGTTATSPGGVKYQCNDGSWQSTAQARPTGTFGGISGTSVSYDPGSSGPTGPFSGTAGATGTHSESTP